MNMDMLTFSEKNGELTAKICGELDHFLASDVRGRIDDMMARKMPSALILDISGVTFMDSSGLGLIMGRYTTCKSRGASFRLNGADSRAMKILELAGLSGVIQTGSTAKGGV